MPYFLKSPYQDKNLNYYRNHPDPYLFIHKLDANNQLIIEVIALSQAINHPSIEPYKSYNSFQEIVPFMSTELLKKAKKNKGVVPFDYFFKLYDFANNKLEINDNYDQIDIGIVLGYLSNSMIALYFQTELFKNRYNALFDFEWVQFDLFAKLVTTTHPELDPHHRFRLKMLPHLLKEDMPLLNEHVKIIYDLENYYKHKKEAISLSPHLMSSYFINKPELQAQIGEIIIKLEEEIALNGEGSEVSRALQKELNNILKNNKLILKCPHIQFFCQRAQDYFSLMHLQDRIQVLVKLKVSAESLEQKIMFISILTEIGEYCTNRKLSKQIREKTLAHLPLKAIITIRDCLEHLDEDGRHLIFKKWLSNGFLIEGIKWTNLQLNFKNILDEINKIITSHYGQPDNFFLNWYDYNYNKPSDPLPIKIPTQEILKFTEGGDTEQIKAVINGQRLLTPNEILDFENEAHKDPENKNIIHKLILIDSCNRKHQIDAWTRKLPLTEFDLNHYLEIIKNIPNTSIWLNCLNTPKLLPIHSERLEIAKLISNPQDRNKFLSVTNILSQENLNFAPLTKLANEFEQSKGISLTRTEKIDFAIDALKNIIKGPLHAKVIHRIFGKRVPTESLEEIYAKHQKYTLEALQQSPEFHHQIYYYLKLSLGLLKKIIKFPETAQEPLIAQNYQDLKKLRNIMAHDDFTFNIIDKPNALIKISDHYIVNGLMQALAIYQSLGKVYESVKRTEKTINFAEKTIEEEASKQMQVSNFLEGTDKINFLTSIATQRLQRLDNIQIKPNKPYSYKEAYEQARKISAEIIRSR